MRKQAIVDIIVATIEQELATATQAALEAAESATDEESRPENKYDTRGLEASYVATAQAQHAKVLKEELQAYFALRLSTFDANDPIALGALVGTLSPSGLERFFIGPAGGGLEIEIESGALTVLTPKSPLGSQLLGKRVGGHTNGESKRTVIRIE